MTITTPTTSIRTNGVTTTVQRGVEEIGVESLRMTRMNNGAFALRVGAVYFNMPAEDLAKRLFAFLKASADLNAAPTVANALVNQNATQDVLFSYQFASNSFADGDVASDGDSLTYSATLSSGAALPAWLTFTPSTRTFSGTPLLANVGVITVLVTATDEFGQAVSDDFTITVAGA